MSNYNDPADAGWVIHVVGPDDIIHQGDELTALREANTLNIAMERERRKYANDPNHPYVIAIVRKRTPRTVFKVRTPSGVFADGEWQRREDVPEKMPDRFEHYFETADYIEEVVASAGLGEPTDPSEG